MNEFVALWVVGAMFFAVVLTVVFAVLVGDMRDSGGVIREVKRQEAKETLLWMLAIPVWPIACVALIGVWTYRALHEVLKGEK